MAIAESLSRLAGTFIAILHTRLELIAVEAEEESLRLFSYLLLSLAAMFFLAMSLLLAVVLVIAVYWDTHRIGVLVSLMTLFGLGGILIGFGVRNHYRVKPKILGHTLSELSKDIDSLKTPSSR